MRLWIYSGELTNWKQNIIDTMLPKIEENFSEDDEVSDVEDIIQEEEGECIDETDEIHDEEEYDTAAWEPDEDTDEAEKTDRQPIIDTQSLRHLKSEKKVVQYEGSPLRSEPDDDIL